MQIKTDEATVLVRIPLSGELHQADIDLVHQAGQRGLDRPHLGLSLRYTSRPLLSLPRPVGGIVQNNQDIGLAATSPGAADEHIDIFGMSQPWQQPQKHGSHAD
ncbi:hypothetical protein D3C85_856480 [compost metagenome]